MNLDNVQNAEVFANIEKQLRMIQCLRTVALELIAFWHKLRISRRNFGLRRSLLFQVITILLWTK